MRNADDNRLTMILTTDTVIDKYQSVWKDHVAFGRNAAALKTRIEEIDEQALIAQGKSRGADVKVSARTALSLAACEMIGAVQTYAADNENLTLAGKVEYSASTLVAGKAHEVVLRCRAIHTTAAEIAAELVEYGITAAKLAAFKKKIDAFDGVKNAPRETIVQRKAANRLLPLLVRAATGILRDQLDGLMLQFKGSAPNFFEEYFAARVVVDSGGGHPDNTDVQATSTPQPAPTPAPTPA